MERERLTEIVGECLPIDREKLTKEKVEKRAENIRESGKYIIFDIERHPGYGNTELPPEVSVTLQTWRYDKKEGTLTKTCEFDRRHYFIEKNERGEPICKNCKSTLDLHEDLFDTLWRCPKCGAVGGKEEGIIKEHPLFGAMIKDESQWKRKDHYWVPRRE